MVLRQSKNNKEMIVAPSPNPTKTHKSIFVGEAGLSQALLSWQVGWSWGWFNKS